MGKALVTGAAGFIGSHLTREIEKNQSTEVVALDDLSGGFRSNVPESVDFIEGSVEDESLIQNIFDEYDIDYVFHLAAYAAEGLSHFIRRFNYKNNLIGSVNLINESIKNEIKCFVFTSSIAVYGDNEVPMREDMTPKPEDPYGIAKYSVEMDLRTAHDMFGMPYVIFRPHNVYGEYQNIGDKYRNVVGIFMNQIMKNEPITIFGDGNQKRAFSYIGDIVKPIAESVYKEEALNRVFNIGADKPYSVNELAKVIIDVMGKKEHPIEHLEPRNEVDVAYCDHSAARKVFGEREHTPLKEGLKKMAKWVKNVGARESSDFHNIEIKKRLPTKWK